MPLHTILENWSKYREVFFIYLLAVSSSILSLTNVRKGFFPPLKGFLSTHPFIVTFWASGWKGVYFNLRHQFGFPFRKQHCVKPLKFTPTNSGARNRRGPYPGALGSLCQVGITGVPWREHQGRVGGVTLASSHFCNIHIVPGRGAVVLGDAPCGVRNVLLWAESPEGPNSERTVVPAQA